MSIAWWERIIYILALAFWRAYFDAKSIQGLATEEEPNAKDLDRARRMADAIRRLRDEAFPKP